MLIPWEFLRLPNSAGGKRQVTKQLEELEANPAGAAIVYEVTLLDSWLDDADAGYYTDESFDPDEIQAIVKKAELIGSGLK